MLRILILSLLFIFSKNGIAEEFEYAIITKNDTAGYLHVSSWTQNDTVFYRYFSDAQTTILKTFHVVSERVCKYLDGQLIFSHCENVVNGDVRDAATTTWKGSYYEIIENDKKELENEAIDFSSVLLFFTEPKYIEKTYSELKAQFLEFSKPAENTYKLSTGWGKHSTYFYENGLLTKAEIVTPFISFELIRH